MNKKEILAKGTIALTLALTTLTSYIYSTDSYAISSQAYETTPDSLNMRSGPSTAYKILAKLPKGTKVEVHQTLNGWVKIKYNNQYGYCNKSYLKLVSSNSTTKNTLNMNVYLRKENNWSSEKLLSIPKGESVTVLSSSNGWVKVSYKNKEGFIASQYIDNMVINGDNSNTTPDVNTPTTPAPSAQTEKATTTNLNMRTGPGTRYAIITNIPANSKVTVVSSSNGWDKIQFNGKTGYANNSYLKPITYSSLDLKVTNTNDTQSIDIISDKELQYSYFYSSSPKQLILDFKFAKINQGQNIDTTVVDGIIIKSYKASYDNTTGTTRLIIELSDDYNTSNTSILGNKNSVNVNFKIVPNQDTTPPETAQNIYYVNTSSLNIRANAGTKYSILGKLTKDTPVEVVSSSNGWAKIKYDNGYGYCNENYLNMVKSTATREEKIEAIVNLTKQQLGKPYLWAATGPDKFDCSGLLLYVHKKTIGLNLPHFSKELAKLGKAIKLDDIQPGDLIYFDSDEDNVVNHCGMYIGNNEWIHAPRAKDFVKIESMNSVYITKYLVTIRRMVN